MSEFNLSDFIPLYLDGTDEHLASLNDSLRLLEQDPTDTRALQEAFRMFHSIKGASVIMGFTSVNKLAHHLESLYDQLRLHKRALDRPLLDLTFRALTELRDYHRQLRAQGQSTADLSALTADVITKLANTREPAAPGHAITAGANEPTENERQSNRTANPASEDVAL